VSHAFVIASVIRRPGHFCAERRVTRGKPVLSLSLERAARERDNRDNRNSAESKTDAVLEIYPSRRSLKAPRLSQPRYKIPLNDRKRRVAKRRLENETKSSRISPSGASIPKATRNSLRVSPLASRPDPTRVNAESRDDKK